MPPLYIATLACGLRDGSRVVSELNGNSCSLETLLQASIADGINNLVWMNSKDGAKNRNRPKGILKSLLKNRRKEENSNRAFDSGEEFEAARKKILNGEK